MNLNLNQIVMFGGSLWRIRPDPFTSHLGAHPSCSRAVHQTAAPRTRASVVCTSVIISVSDAAARPPTLLSLRLSESVWPPSFWNTCRLGHAPLTPLPLALHVPVDQQRRQRGFTGECLLVWPLARRFPTPLTGSPPVPTATRCPHVPLLPLPVLIPARRHSNHIICKT